MEINTLCWQCIFDALILLITANGAPILLRDLLGSRAAWPVDFAYTFFDNKPILGHSKTWRGILVSVLASSLIALSLSLSCLTGALFGLFAMSGDLAASFTKRRLNYVESSRFRLLDVLPESLLPLLILHDSLSLNWLAIILTVALFFVFEVLVSPLLFRLHIRNRPY